MAFGEHKAVVMRVYRILRIKAHRVKKERRNQIRGGKARGRMTRTGF